MHWFEREDVSKDILDDFDNYLIKGFLHKGINYNSITNSVKGFDNINDYMIAIFGFDTVKTGHHQVKNFPEMDDIEVKCKKMRYSNKFEITYYCKDTNNLPRYLTRPKGLKNGEASVHLIVDYKTIPNREIVSIKAEIQTRRKDTSSYFSKILLRNIRERAKALTEAFEFGNSKNWTIPDKSHYSKKDRQKLGRL